MISRLKVERLKSLPYFDHPFKPLTLLAGLNSSGKSTVIHALRMLTHAQLGEDAMLSDFGPFRELLFKRQTSESESKTTSSIHINVKYLDGHANSLLLTENEQHLRGEPRYAKLFRYLGAHRLGPQLYLPMSYKTGMAFDVGERGEFVIDCLSRYSDAIVPPELKHGNSRGDTLSFNTKAWLEVVSPGYELNTQTLSRQDLALATYNNIRPHNVGFGLSYTLPVIVSLLGLAAIGRANSANYIVAIENPEAHLHPCGQTEIGRLIALAASAGVQVIVETHSDYVLDGIRIAIKDQLLEHESATFLFFELDENRESKVDRIFSDKRGKLSGWPVGFFDQGRNNKAELAGF
ncbi:MAG: DUF3696 domain-containing protein [Pseudomonadota bacterium]